MTPRRRELIRQPSLRGRLAARTSWKRYVRHGFGLKAPRGYGWLTNPRKAAYNRIYYRTSVSAERAIGWLFVGGVLLLLGTLGCC